ncbi:hypothetical protein WJX81_001237 [Elliptochloris bilobata]|uniref:Kinesin motor domain-containing protein n=1 Tax=Elliptochloris bilobata TaxID=381761 RepID=A0AAW1RTU8_9CHLO
MPRDTRIPRPPARQRPLQDLTASDLNVGKKRAAASPAAGKLAKRAVQGDDSLSWESVAEEAGWVAAEDALQHTIRLKKNERDAALVKKVCLEYIRQLRALGWFLNSALAQMEGEESLLLHTAEAAKHKAAAEALERQLEAALTRVASLQGQLDSEAAGHSDTRASLQRAEAQVASVADLHAQSQRYCAQLQEYNANLQKDVQAAASQLQVSALQLQRVQEEKAEAAELAAALRGTLRARDTELAAAHGEVAVATAARQAATDDTARSRAELDALRAELEKARTAAKGIDALSKDLIMSQADALARCAEAERVRREMHNTILDLKGAIRVFVRVRPAADEAQQSVRFCGSGALELQTGQGRTAGVTAFSFDRIFAPSAPQEEVFDEVSQLVQSAMDGYRVCIFAYGATGSGKTHTMIGGGGKERGVIPRSIDKLYARACELQQLHGWSIMLKATCLEVFCDELIDLLGDGPPAGKKHTISHGAGCVERRSVAATACNERSSRSHLVFALAVSASNCRTGQKMLGLLNLVDLAGSERLSKSGAASDRLKETQAINKSLSSLGDVIAALGSKAEHVPYRNSKLTWLLQPCLSADAKTLFIINISADSQAATQESLCSLRFGAKINATTIGVPRPCRIERLDSKQASRA